MIKKLFTLILTIFLFIAFRICTVQCQVHRTINQSSTDDTPYNVVVVLVDDLGWKDLGYAGSSLYQTPNLDELARHAIVFTQAYSGHPVCSPSRAAIMTGKSPTRVHITDWIPGQRPENKPLITPEIKNELPLAEKTIAEYFKEGGYKTFYAGKWHLGDHPFSPENQGFDINIGGIDKGSPPGGYYVPYNNPKLPDGPEGEYLTDRLTDETINFISKNQNDRFFAFLSFYNVHTPIQANNEDRPRYDGLDIPDVSFSEHDAKTLLYQNNLDYASMVTAMDRNVGKLIRALKKLDLWENTVFLFSSDNGGLSTLFYDWKIPTSNMPLRAGKGWCYEGGIRIPQILHIPGHDEAGSKIDVPTVHQDILPTLWSAARMEGRIEGPLDGKNILQNNNLSDRTLFWDYPHYHGSGWRPGAAIREGDWKLIHFYESQDSELYNLASDPEESIDLSEIHPDKKQSMWANLKKLIKEHTGEFPQSNPDFKPK